VSATPAPPNRAATPVADLPPSVANLARARRLARVPPAAAGHGGAALAKPLPRRKSRWSTCATCPSRSSARSRRSRGRLHLLENPADRLLLVDKILRHEGEEVAPGLLLENCSRKRRCSTSKATATAFRTEL
jgi:general secretion pathway protein B